MITAHWLAISDVWASFPRKRWMATTSLWKSIAIRLFNPICCRHHAEIEIDDKKSQKNTDRLRRDSNSRTGGGTCWVKGRSRRSVRCHSVCGGKSTHGTDAQESNVENFRRVVTCRTSPTGAAHR